MTLNEFQEHVKRTGSTAETYRGHDIAPDTCITLCSILGLAGETGEVCDLMKKQMFHNKPITNEAIALELGDVLWYVAMMAHQLGYSLDEIAIANVAKLAARYPNGFNFEDANNRQVDTGY